MEAASLLSALESCLTPEIASLRGSLSIHGHEGDAIAHLLTGTDRWRCVLLADDELMEDDPGMQEGGIVDHGLRVLVQHQAGPLDYQKGANQFKSDGKHVAPLLTRCTQVRLLILRTRFQRALSPDNFTDAPDVDHVQGWRYLGRKAYAPTADLLALRTWELSFRLRAGLLTPDFDGEDAVLFARLPD